MDAVHDLPPDMLAIGWRKFWSKREGRPYFFNKITNESLWEPPHLVLRSNPLTDPLGISSPVAPPHHPTTVPVTPTTPNEPLSPSFPWSMTHQQQPQQQHQRGEKRPLDEGQGGGGFGSAWKKAVPILTGPWALEKTTNVVIWERLPCLLHHAHPEVELLRGNLMAKLRQEYVTMCKSRENIEAPKESFNRWLLERKLSDRGSDPLFPTNCTPEVSRSMYNEIMNDIPCKLFRPKFTGDARKQLSKYAEGAKAMMESRNASGESRKIVKWNVEDTFQWIRKTLNASFEDYQERLRHLRHQCQPHLTEAAKSSVEGIVSKIYTISCEDGKRVQEKVHEILRENKINELSGPPRMSQQPKKVYCYPIHLIHPSPKLPPVQFCQEKDVVFLGYKNETVKLKQVYLQKLEYLYRCSCSDDRKFEYFLTRVWCLLKRYKSFLGPGLGEGHSTQVSLTTPVFDCMHKAFEVTFEAFASPLNCYFRQYCSPFPDTDAYFGSRGSFLTFHPVGGSFSVHPPYQEDLMEVTVDHIDRCLHNSSDPLSFIVFLPDWVEPVSKAVKKMEASRFKRKQLSLEACEYEFRNGFQHMCEPKDLIVKSSHNTLVFFVQNDAGFLRWGPTPDRLEALTDAFKPGREGSSASTSKDLSLLSPPPTPQAPATLAPGTCASGINSTGNNNNGEASNSAIHNAPEVHQSEPVDLITSPTTATATETTSASSAIAAVTDSPTSCSSTSPDASAP